MMTFDIDQAIDAMVLEDSYAYPTRFHAYLAFMEQSTELKRRQLFWEIDGMLKAELLCRIRASAHVSSHAHTPTDGQSQAMGILKACQE